LGNTFIIRKLRIIGMRRANIGSEFLSILVLKTPAPPSTVPVIVEGRQSNLSPQQD
jgi:hypothetical protein